MPDPRKLEVLRSIGYKVQPVCGNCVHFTTKLPALPWGTCNLRIYQHGTHTEPRSLTVNRAGTCEEHRLAKRDETDLKQSGFDTFLQSLARPCVPCGYCGSITSMLPYVDERGSWPACCSRDACVERWRPTPLPGASGSPGGA